MESNRSEVMWAVHVGDPINSSRTGDTTLSRIAKPCEAVASDPILPSDGRSTEVDLASTAGLLSEPSRGSISFDAFEFATSDARTFTRRSSRSVVRSLPGAS
jgi:hypothetical protein